MDTGETGSEGVAGLSRLRCIQSRAMVMNGDERSASVKGGEFFCQTSDWQILYAESALWSK